ncbi:MAG: sulfurtransferase TusA family protein [Halapricum sp.]
MSTEHTPTETLDVKGESCPMPVVKTRQAIEDLDTGAVLEIVATDSGSMSDIEGWANSTRGVELLNQTEDEADGRSVYRHYVRRTE